MLLKKYDEYISVWQFGTSSYQIESVQSMSTKVGDLFNQASSCSTTSPGSNLVVGLPAAAYLAHHGGRARTSSGWGVSYGDRTWHRSMQFRDVPCWGENTCVVTVMVGHSGLELTPRHGIYVHSKTLTLGLG